MYRLPAGYVISPNNIIGAPGVFIYAGGPGIKGPNNMADINLKPNGEIVVGRIVVEGEAYTKEARLVFKVDNEFKDANEFEEFYKVNGVVSEGGVPAGSCGVWD